MSNVLFLGIPSALNGVPQLCLKNIFLAILLLSSGCGTLLGYRSRGGYTLEGKGEKLYDVIVYPVFNHSESRVGVPLLLQYHRTSSPFCVGVMAIETVSENNVSNLNIVSLSIRQDGFVLPLISNNGIVSVPFSENKAEHYVKVHSLAPLDETLPIRLLAEGYVMRSERRLDFSFDEKLTPVHWRKFSWFVSIFD